jgi:RNA-binding protein YlmH
MRRELQAQKAECLKSFTDAEDKILFAKAFDKYEACTQKSLPAFTDFMDPRRAEAFLLCFRRVVGLAATEPDFSIKNTLNGFIRVFGGCENAERKIIGFSMENNLNGEGFPITPLFVKFNKRFAKPPSHRDYLGSILGLGLERAKIGDIYLAENGAVIYTATDVADYIAANLIKVGNAPVTVSIHVNADLEGLMEPGTEMRFTAASLRLDAVISGAFRLSRAKADALIAGEKVFVNWKAALNGAKALAEGDMVTVRGLGRMKLETVEGKTKKDRTAVRIILY